MKLSIGMKKDTDAFDVIKKKKVIHFVNEYHKLYEIKPITSKAF